MFVQQQLLMAEAAWPGEWVDEPFEMQLDRQLDAISGVNVDWQIDELIK